jgi:hypothetical protein
MATAKGGGRIVPFLMIKITYEWDGVGTSPLSRPLAEKYRVQVTPLEVSKDNMFQVIGAVHAVAQWLITISGQDPVAAMWWLRNAQAM